MNWPQKTHVMIIFMVILTVGTSAQDLLPKVKVLQKMPKLRGFTEKQARERLSRDVKVEIIRILSSSPKGTVLRTTPKRGKDLHAGDLVHLVIAAPPLEFKRDVESSKLEREHYTWLPYALYLLIQLLTIYLVVTFWKWWKQAKKRRRKF